VQVEVELLQRPAFSASDASWSASHPGCSHFSRLPHRIASLPFVRSCGATPEYVASWVAAKCSGAACMRQVHTASLALRDSSSGAASAVSVIVFGCPTTEDVMLEALVAVVSRLHADLAPLADVLRLSAKRWAASADGVRWDGIETLASVVPTATSTEFVTVLAAELRRAAVPTVLRDVRVTGGAIIVAVSCAWPGIPTR
jgi:hypothetical protein